MAEVELGSTVAALQPLLLPQKELFDTINSLRDVEVQDIVRLPQILVVGHQSSGKSSVLQAISRVRFPTKAGLCTRFATELVLRKDESTLIDVSIIRKGGILPIEEKLRSISSKDDIPELIEEAKQHIGIDTSPSGFSTDILRIKISASDVPNLTLIDLPGFYFGEDETQTLEGQEVVRQLAREYMKQDTSIILAVMSAREDIVNQTATNEAKKPDIDPQFERTIGVITQLDRVTPGSDEENRWVSLAKGQNRRFLLKHGFHLLRNRSQDEADFSDDQRDSAEKAFFSKGAWSSIRPENKGIASFRSKLSKLLFEHIAHHLPGVVSDIEQSMTERKAELMELGSPRSDAGQIREYLVNIAGKFEHFAQNAVQGNYVDIGFFNNAMASLDGTDAWDLRVRKLRAVVRDLNRAFVAVMCEKGHQRVIQWNDGSEMETINSVEIPDYLGRIIDEFYDAEEPSTVLEDDLKEEVELLAAENQGCEFPGEPNYGATLQFFQQHSSPWKGIATSHVELVVFTVEQFADELLTYVFGADEATRERVRMNYLEPFLQERRAVMLEKVDELLPQQTGYSIALEREFEDRSMARYLDRLTRQIKALAEQDRNGRRAITSENIDVMLENTKLGQAYIDGPEGTRGMSAIEKMIDRMVVHYEFWLRNFTENVIILVIENQFIRNIPRILQPAQFVNMKDSDAEALAAEPHDIQERRNRLRGEVDRLDRGFTICRRLQRRKQANKPLLKPKGRASQAAPAATILRRSPSPGEDLEEELLLSRRVLF